MLNGQMFTGSGLYKVLKFGACWQYSFSSLVLHEVWHFAICFTAIPNCNCSLSPLLIIEPLARQLVTKYTSGP